MSGKDSSPGRHRSFKRMKVARDLKLSTGKSASWNFGWGTRFDQWMNLWLLAETLWCKNDAGVFNHGASAGAVIAGWPAKAKVMGAFAQRNQCSDVTTLKLLGYRTAEWLQPALGTIPRWLAGNHPESREKNFTGDWVPKMGWGIVFKTLSVTCVSYRGSLNFRNSLLGRFKFTCSRNFFQAIFSSESGLENAVSMYD